MQCVILAGGLGTRMRPATAQVPKVLLPVAGSPFANHQLAWLAAAGVDEVVFCIGHLGDRIRTFVGDGRRWDLQVSYSDEGDELLGTAGALRVAYDAGLLQSSFLVIYGDSYLDIDVGQVWAAFRASGAPALMTVHRNTGRWGPSNATLRRGWVVRYDKAPRAGSGDMEYIDYGLLAMGVDVVRRVPPNRVIDLSSVLGDLASAGQLAGYEATRRFYEIGSPEGLRELEDLLTGRRPGAGSTAGRPRPGSGSQ